MNEPSGHPAVEGIGRVLEDIGTEAMRLLPVAGPEPEEAKVPAHANEPWRAGQVASRA